MIPQGTYKAKAIGGMYGTSKQKGTPFVRVSFAVTEGDYAGHSVGWDGYFTPNTEARTLDSLRYCGCNFPNDDLSNLAGIEKNEVSIVIEHERWNDEKTGEEKARARVAWVNSPGGIPDDQQMDANQLAAFAARMKGSVMRVKQKPGIVASSPNGGTPRAPAPRTGGVVDDPYGHAPQDGDIPFISSQPNRWGL